MPALLVSMALCLLGTTYSLQKIRDIEKHKNFHVLHSEGQCDTSGKIPDRFEPRMLGGTDAKLGEFPWMVLLFYKKFIHSTYHEYPECGGSVISSRLVLTAAHCLSRADALSFVRLGEYDRASRTDCSRSECAPEPTDVYDFETIVHGGFDDRRRLNDLGLIRLKHKLRFNNFIRPICLPPESDSLASEFEGKPLTVTGWGELVTRPSVTEARVLHRMVVEVLPDRECNLAAPTATSQAAFMGAASGQACFGGQAQGGACVGDGGDPVVYTDPSSGARWLMGLVSFARPDCMRGWQYVPYTVFTWIPHHLTWILDHVHVDD